jgi:hypothetical protein
LGIWANASSGDYSSPEISMNLVSGGGGSSVSLGSSTPSDEVRLNNPSGTNVNLTNSTWTPITFTSEEYDSNNMHSTSSNTSRITFQKAGTYNIESMVRFNGVSTAGQRDAKIVRNSPTTCTGDEIGYAITNAAGTGSTLLPLSTTERFNAGDYIELCAYQSSGGTITADGGTYPGASTSLTATIQSGGTGSTGTLQQAYDNSANPATIQVGSGKPFVIQAASGTSDTNLFQINKSDGTNILTVDTTNAKITLGTASATPVLLVLGTKNTTGDPTCTSGAIYYNSATSQSKVCINGGWTAVGVPRVNSLPSTPSDGDEVYYVADATNGVVWHLRYNSGSASAYKWEYLGGGPLYAEVNTEEATATTGAWVDLTTVGPSITLPLAGDYDFHWGAIAEWTGAGGSAGIAAAGISIGATDPSLSGNPNNPDVAVFRGAAANQWSSVDRQRRKTVSSASTVAKVRYYTNNLNGDWGSRWLSIVPVRVN